MDTMITKERKDEIILSLRKFIVDNDDKVALYDEIYHQTCCGLYDTRGTNRRLRKRITRNY